MLRPFSFAFATVFAAGLLTPSSPAIAQTSHVAYVYVSDLVSPDTSTKHDLYAYGARADGSLYRVTGTPFNYDVKNLFGLNGTQIDSYWISSTGAPQLVGTIDAAADAPDFCGGIGPLKVDHSGRNLYNPIAVGDCMGFSYQSYGISGTT